MYYHEVSSMDVHTCPSTFVYFCSGADFLRGFSLHVSSVGTLPEQVPPSGQLHGQDGHTKKRGINRG